MCVGIHVHVCAFMHVYACVYEWVCVRVCMRVCVVYVCLHAVSEVRRPLVGMSSPPILVLWKSNSSCQTWQQHLYPLSHLAAPK